MAKKGQITIFIIIGLLLIVSIGIYIYATQEAATAPLEAEEAKVAAVPAEVQPLREFVTNCLYITAKQGLTLIGERGGYIEPLQRYNPAEPTEGSAVQFAPGSKLKIPYWWHLASKNECVGNCEFRSERPSLETIKAQMDGYISEELPKCLGTFEQFRNQQFTITPIGAIDPDTRITKGNVAVLLAYPLNAEKAGVKFELKDFATTLPVNFYEIYILATNITNIQAEHSILERATRNLIDIFGRADSEALPPVSEMEFGFGSGTIWTKFDVEEKIMQMLTSYIPLLKVPYTRNYRYIPAPAGADKKMYEVFYNRGFVVPVLEQHKSLAVNFAYLPWWKPYLNLNCNGQLCQPEGISSTIGFLFGMRRYNFAYDVSYPVLVDIKNPDAYGGEGYSLRFFLEANMRNNAPLASLEPPLAVASIETSSSMMCDPEQRTGGNITINVRTSAGQPVDNAEILYKCGSETCRIGTSAQGQLLARFPRCVGGFITATHENYPAEVKPLDVIDSTAQTVDIILKIAYPVDFKVKKWMLKKYGTGWELDSSQVVNQGKSENTMIMLEKKGLEFEEPLVIVGEVCGAPMSKAKIPCGNPPSDSSKGVNMYSGDYHVTIYSFMYPSPDLTIPPDRRCVSQGPFKKKKCFWVPPKSVVFSTSKPLMSGSAEYDWSISEEELKAAKSIEFSYINFALDKVQPASSRKIEDLEVMGNLPSYSEQFADLLNPVIRNE